MDNIEGNVTGTTTTEANLTPEAATNILYKVNISFTREEANAICVNLLSLLLNQTPIEAGKAFAIVSTTSDRVQPVSDAK